MLKLRQYMQKLVRIFCALLCFLAGSYNLWTVAAEDVEPAPPLETFDDAEYIANLQAAGYAVVGSGTYDDPYTIIDSSDQPDVMLMDAGSDVIGGIADWLLVALGKAVESFTGLSGISEIKAVMSAAANFDEHRQALMDKVVEGYDPITKTWKNQINTSDLKTFGKNTIGQLNGTYYKSQPTLINVGETTVHGWSGSKKTSTTVKTWKWSYDTVYTCDLASDHTGTFGYTYLGGVGASTYLKTKFSGASITAKRVFIGDPKLSYYKYTGSSSHLFLVKYDSTVPFVIGSSSDSIGDDATWYSSIILPASSSTSDFQCALWNVTYPTPTISSGTAAGTVDFDNTDFDTRLEQALGNITINLPNNYDYDLDELSKKTAQEVLNILAGQTTPTPTPTSTPTPGFSAFDYVLNDKGQTVYAGNFGINEQTGFYASDTRFSTQGIALNDGSYTITIPEGLKLTILTQNGTAYSLYSRWWGDERSFTLSKPTTVYFSFKKSDESSLSMSDITLVLKGGNYIVPTTDPSGGGDTISKSWWQTNLIEPFGALLGGIGNGLTDLKDIVVGGFENALTGLKDIIAGIGTQIGHLADIVANTAPIQGIKDILLGMADNVSAGWSALSDWCADLPGIMEDMGKSITTSISGVMVDIKALVIPDTDVVAQSFDEVKTIAEDKVGILGYPFVVLGQFFDLFTKNTSGRGCIVWGDAVYDHTVYWHKGEVCLADYVDRIGYRSQYNLYLDIMDGVLVIGVVLLCAHKFRRIFGK